MRRPAVAGMFYPGTEKGLLKEVRNCFKQGPGRDNPVSGPKVIGIVSPHAGYAYSGPTAAHGFLAIVDGGMPRTVIVIGPNHNGLGSPVSVSYEDFEMPMGVMECDRELAEAIHLPRDELSHVSEHSMEVQLPFIQFFDRTVMQVCISMLDQSLGTAREVARNIVEAVKRTGRDTAIVASSDFTHCGPNYGYRVPEGMNAGEFARSRDMPVIDRLLDLDVEGAFGEKMRLGTTACGMGPIAAMYTAAVELGASSAELLNYTTSYDVIPAASAVGYASIVLR